MFGCITQDDVLAGVALLKVPTSDISEVVFRHER